MSTGILRFLIAILVASAVPEAAAQAQPVQAPPPMVPIVGTLLDGSGQPQTGQTIVTLSIYGAQTDGTPLWQERQAVTPDSRGRYSITLGSVTQGGLPTGLFAGSEVRWLGIQPEGLAEQERILLTSVPYALKSGDANTLGGLPASAFMLSGKSTAAPAKRTNEGTDAAALGKAAASSSSSEPTTGPGTLDQVIPDDLIVQGSACIGLDCVNNESFGFDTIRLKENNTRIKFEDTSVGSFPSTDWQLTANDSASGGANKFSIEDITGAKVPFTLTAGGRRTRCLWTAAGGWVCALRHRS